MTDHMVLNDIAILKALGGADDDFRSIMLLTRQLQESHVIDAGTLKTIEDLLFVARVGLADVAVKVIDRLTQYRELTQAVIDVVADVEKGELDVVWPQVISVKPDFRPAAANDRVGGVA